MADQSVAYSADRLQYLNEQERAATGCTHKFVIDYTDINDSTWTTDGDTVTVSLITTVADWVVLRGFANVTTAFTTDGTLTMAVGTDGNVDSIIDETSVKTAGPLVDVAGGIPAVLADSNAAAADTLVAQFATQAATGAPADIDAGSVTIYLQLLELNKV